MRSIVILFIMIIANSCQTDAGKVEIELEGQLIGITSAHNARQLGGYVIGGRQVRNDLLLRAARLSGLTPEDSALLAERYRVQRIYDFRSQEESVSSPDVIPGNARYLSISLPFADKERSSVSFSSNEEMIGMLLKYADNPMIQDMCTHMYDKIFFVEQSQDVYRRFFADLMTVDPEDGAVLWHCTQGKDRAGSASAMLLAALGADRELIMADFCLSKDYYDPKVAMIKTENETQANVINTLISANPAIFEATLDKVDQKYGSLRNYLTECIGVTPEMMEVLRESYLE